MEEENVRNKNYNPLELTEKEKIALQIYGGAMPRTTIYPVLSENESSYCIINALFFPGIETELTRILDDDRELEPEVIEAADELLDIIETLYSAMYKSGKKMDKPKKAYRIERTSSMKEIKNRGTTISNTSTTKMNSFEYNFFGKYDNTYLEINIEEGTPCFDYEETFNRLEYILVDEREILIAPGCKIVLGAAENDYTWMTEEQRNKFYKATISAPEKAKPLSEKEEEDKKKMLGIFEDEDLRSNAVNVIRKINEYYENELELTAGNPKAKEEARNSLSSLEIEQYTQWKEAFLAYIKYRFREIALEIDAALEANKNKKQKISGFKKDILKKIIYKVVKGMKSITSHKSKNDKQQYETTDILGLSEQGIEMMNSEAVGEIFKTTVATGKKKTRTENNSIEEV